MSMVSLQLDFSQQDLSKNIQTLMDTVAAHRQHLPKGAYHWCVFVFVYALELTFVCIGSLLLGNQNLSGIITQVINRLLG